MPKKRNINLFFEDILEAITASRNIPGTWIMASS